MFVCEFLEVRCNHLARAAPVGVDCRATVLVTLSTVKAEGWEVQSATTTLVLESRFCHSAVEPILILIVATLESVYWALKERRWG
jgi:hypothetical protein